MTAEPAPVDTAGRDRALALAVRHINASTPVAIPDAELLAILQAGGVTYGQLAGLADRHLAAGHPTRRWLDERRGL